MSLLNVVINVINRVLPANVAYAHCDIPCGIYDPHLAQISALTVVRMNQLIDGLTVPGTDASGEEHAELCKRELRILWSDYFKDEHVQQYPDLHDKFFNALKLASGARQNQDIGVAQQLLAATQKIAELFWKTKGATPVRQPSRQGAAGGELVYPS